MASRLVGLLGVSAAAVCALVAPGAAQTAPLVTSVAISGEAVVDSTLTATAVVADPATVVEYRWQRCATDTGNPQTDCKRIMGSATTPSYRVAAEDVGNHVAVRAVPAGGDVNLGAWSALTAIVSGPPAPQPTPTPTPTPTPAPTPTPTPTPEPTPEPTPTPTPAPDEDQPPAPAFDQGGRQPAEPAEPAAPVAKRRPRYLRPFPVVRVKGTLVLGGARISLLRVRAPSAATVAVRCARAGCRLSRRSVGGGRVRELERFVRVGTRITIRVSKPGAVGKYVRLVIRDGTAPRRRDACLLPGSTRPAECPPV